MTATSPQFDVQPTAGNHFAWVNTQLALQRTLMAAVRTATALIGFGFTVAQFFEKMQQGVPEELRFMRPQAPRNFGLALIAAGVASLAVFTWQYHIAADSMRK